jgi:hypothetical protein
MIVIIHASGKSFSGAAAYLTHDPKEETAERVAWTHTLNLANDHVPSAVDEMYRTAQNAELLKQEAGIRAGGRATENPVKHLSLSWSPEDNPTREHMIETTEQFLEHMKWREHQALLVAHDDKAHAHVHVMLNVIHPETGLRLNDDFERRRAQAWALEYEQEQGRVYCEQRLKAPEEREDAPTRPAWAAFEKNRQKFEREEKILENQNPILINEQDFPKNTHDDEWKILKQIQRDQRMQFFEDGKSAFSELRSLLYREVREEFRDRWSNYYEAKRNGGEGDLAALKAELVAEQKLALEARRDEECFALREYRNRVYRDLLDDQREIRLGLRERQEAGFENELFLDLAKQRDPGTNMAAVFREAADEATREYSNAGWNADLPSIGRPERSDAGMKSGTAIGTNIGEGLGFGVISLLDGLADGIMGGKPAPPPRQPEPEPPGPDPHDAFFKAAQERQRLDQEEADREYQKRQRSYGE